MTQEHPITPPPELVRQWARYQGFESPEVLWRQIATQAARWGADQELEACVKWLKEQRWEALAIHLRAARRPKPPSLKEQSIALIDKIQGNKEMWDIRDLDVIRQALESLPSTKSKPVATKG